MCKSYGPLYFFNCGCAFGWFLRDFYIYWIQVYYQIRFTNILCQSVDCLFVLLKISFEEQKFSILMKTNSFNQLCFSATYIYKKKSLPNPGHKDFILCSKHFTVLGFTFQSMIHFEFFLYGTSHRLKFIFWHSGNQFFSSIAFLKDFFLHWVAFASLSKISCPCMHGSVSGLFIVFLWSTCVSWLWCHTVLITVAL